MGNENASGWRYTARYGWNWRSVRAISGALGSLTLPMPPWFRAVVARCLLTRTALHADAEGIWGSAGAAAGPGGPRPSPWKDVTDVVVWDYNHLRIIGLARRGDAIGGGPAARALASRAPAQSRPPRRRAQLRHPSYAAFIAPDGSPYDAAYVVTANGWCVDTGPAPGHRAALCPAGAVRQLVRRQLRAGVPARAVRGSSSNFLPA